MKLDGDPRTAGERNRDLTISVMDKTLDVIKIHLKNMEDSAAFNREYQHAKNYAKITTLIKEAQKYARS